MIVQSDTNFQAALVEAENDVTITVHPHPASQLEQASVILSGLDLAARPGAGPEVPMLVAENRTAMARRRLTPTSPVQATSILNPVVTPI